MGACVLKIGPSWEGQDWEKLRDWVNAKGGYSRRLENMKNVEVAQRASSDQITKNCCEDI